MLQSSSYSPWGTGRCVRVRIKRTSVYNVHVMCVWVYLGMYVPSVYVHLSTPDLLLGNGVFSLPQNLNVIQRASAIVYFSVGLNPGIKTSPICSITKYLTCWVTYCLFLRH